MGNLSCLRKIGVTSHPGLASRQEASTIIYSSDTLHLTDRRSSSSRRKRLLAHNPVTTDQQDQSLQAQNYSKSDHSADDTVHDRAETVATSALRGGRRRTRSITVVGSVRGVSGASALSVSADVAPVLRVTDGELVHARVEIAPADDVLLTAEKRVCDRLGVLTGSTVGEEESNVNVVCGWVVARRDLGGSVGEELEGHGRGVVDDAAEVRVGLLQVCEAEEAGESGVGAKLHADLLLALSGDGGVEELDDFACEDHGAHGADVVGGALALVVGEAPLVGVGEVGQVGEDVGGDEVGARVAGVVDLGNVD